MLVQWLKLPTDDLRTKLFNMAIAGEATDVKLVCEDGDLFLHRPELELYLPEVTSWIPSHHHCSDILVNLKDFSVLELVAAIKEMYLEDNPNKLRRIFQIQEVQGKVQNFLDDDAFCVTKMDPILDINAEDSLLFDDEMVKDEASQQVIQGADDELMAALSASPPPLADDEPSSPEPGPLAPATSDPARQRFLPCPACDKDYFCIQSLRAHERKEHQGTTLARPHRCTLHPDEYFDNFEELKEHFKFQHSGKYRVKEEHELDEITLMVKAEDNTIKQFSVNLKDNKCKMCMKLGGDALQQHVERYHVPVTCHLCHKVVSGRKHLGVHLASHKNNEVNIVCQECGKVFPDRKTVNKHYSSVHTEKKFKCSQCPLLFRNNFQLRDHEERKHGNSAYPCATCGKAFGSKILLKNHERTHNAVRKYSCDFCEKRFRTRDKLNKHQAVHTKIKFSCEICASAFSRMETLKSHMKLHDESRALKCSECSKLFDTNQKYREHMNTHTGAKPFKCEGCSAAFSSSSSLCHHKKSCTFYIDLKKDKDVTMTVTTTTVSVPEFYQTN
eukprot:TRINITY_DN4167_c0_g1_i7.p1 TRINITY_DN4167_c0_g1~~TRINITY_DN4167_c0_g1_i7.p1  ORF type:complete len:557 (-),score=90.17 TRINITY_DN4167_c0_g1_i7:24-1694(-)